MMTQQFNTKLKGKLVLTDSYHADKALQKEKSLYKFIWVRSGSITLEIDHQEVMLVKNEIISLSNLQHLEFKSIDGDYLHYYSTAISTAFTEMTTRCLAAGSYSTAPRMWCVSR